ncbi:hypothetical protein BY996DRAFT_6512450 [Phakopsora pachyrhizi]|nr:hypothetical protein BY996DRAFT_6512450 [Phakopsora pachyrhizi]
MELFNIEAALKAPRSGELCSTPELEQSRRQWWVWTKGVFQPHLFRPFGWSCCWDGWVGALLAEPSWSKTQRGKKKKEERGKRGTNALCLLLVALIAGHIVPLSYLKQGQEGRAPAVPQAVPELLWRTDWVARNRVG